jgi:hypothetical protein
MLPAIRALIDDYRARRWDSHPLEKALQIALNHPAAVAELAISIIDELPDGDTFLDMAFSYLPIEDWPAVVQHALAALGGKAENKAAESVIEYASLQCLTALHPHLEEIFAINPYPRSCRQHWPWRESGTQSFAFLRRVLERPTATSRLRRNAWEAMLETREPEVMEYALRRVGHRPAVVRARVRRTSEAMRLTLSCLIRMDTPRELARYLDEVGYDRSESILRPLYPERVYHLVFPEPYVTDESTPYWARVHPTWKRQPGNTPSMTFGGEGREACVVCGGTLHHMLTLASIPDGVGVTGLSRLELATCLSCLGWEVAELFYAHDTLGRPQCVGYRGPRVEPQFPAEPLPPTEVQLVETEPRWRWQDWGLSNDRENLHRLGGHPCWIQSAQYLRCPACGQKMRFLMQLDSNLRTSTGGEWLWGSGGLCYINWCDGCKVSGFLWQCT